MLTSLDQKVRSRLPLSTLGAHGHDDCRGRVGVYPTASIVRNTVNPYPRLARGKPTAREAVGGAGRRSRRKRMPARNGSDTEADASARKDADFRVVFRDEIADRTS